MILVRFTDDPLCEITRISFSAGFDVKVFLGFFWSSVVIDLDVASGILVVFSVEVFVVVVVLVVVEDIITTFGLYGAKKSLELSLRIRKRESFSLSTSLDCPFDNSAPPLPIVGTPVPAPYICDKCL